jgi:hypothetical protein
MDKLENDGEANMSILLEGTMLFLIELKFNLHLRIDDTFFES